MKRYRIRTSKITALALLWSCSRVEAFSVPTQARAGIHPHNKERKRRRRSPSLGAFSPPASISTNYWSPLFAQDQHSRTRLRNFESQEADLLLAIRQSTGILSVRDYYFLQDDNPHIAAAALKRITQLLSIDSEQKKFLALNQQLIPMLLRRLELLAAQCRWTTAADVLTPLSILQTRHGIDTQSVATKLWNRLQSDPAKFARTQNPRLLLECMRAALALQLKNGNGTAELYSAISHRLVQGDALSKFTGVDVVRLLVSLSASQHVWNDQGALVFALARRLRKQNVRARLKSHEMMRGLGALSKFTTAGNEKVKAECRIASYTLLKHFLLVCDTDEAEERPLRCTEAVLLLQTAFDTLQLESNDPLLEPLYQRIEKDEDSIMKSAHINQLGHFCRYALHASMRLRTTSWARRISRKFAQGVRAKNDSDGKKDAVSIIISPQTVSHILRYAVLAKHPADAYRMPARDLFLNQEFLQQCQVSHLSNFVWFLHRTHWFDDVSVTLALGRRVLEVYETCSPQHASRLLAAFTSIFASCSTQNDAAISAEQEELLSSLFQLLGEPLLLSTKMSPVDASSAIYAYAKASYIQDMGIFDHLVDMMASMLSEKDVTVRQVAQSLWACGKMAGFESDMDEYATEAPYRSTAVLFTDYLFEHVDSLTTKDVAQSLWAVGRLRMLDKNDAIQPLVLRAQELASDLNNQEVANILWALSKLRSLESKVVFQLTRRFAGDSPDELAPQEAANILYALGRLNIRDEAVFQNLSHVIMEHIDSTSAQAVANVLWAHENVFISAPQQLLDLWVNEKLGLVSVQPQVEIDPYENYY